jgi:hypothetical protein
MIDLVEAIDNEENALELLVRIGPTGRSKRNV